MRGLNGRLDGRRSRGFIRAKESTLKLLQLLVEAFEEIVIIRDGKAEIFSEMPRSAVAAG